MGELGGTGRARYTDTHSHKVSKVTVYARSCENMTAVLEDRFGALIYV